MLTLRSIKNAESTSSFDKNQTCISWRFVVKIEFWIHLQIDLHFSGNSMLEIQAQSEELKQSQYYVRMHEHSKIGLFFCYCIYTALTTYM